MPITQSEVQEGCDRKWSTNGPESIYQKHLIVQQNSRQKIIPSTCMTNPIRLTADQTKHSIPMTHMHPAQIGRGLLSPVMQGRGQETSTDTLLQIIYIIHINKRIFLPKLHSNLTSADV